MQDIVKNSGASGATVARPQVSSRSPQLDSTLGPSHPHHAKKPRKSWPLLKIFVISLVVVVLGAVAVIVWQQIRINEGMSEEDAARGVQNRVAKIMILPDEDALVSTIGAVDEIKEQPFFSSAQNGDKVLIFVQAAKIVIYRESSNQIVNAGPLIDDRAEADKSDE